jgi:hypothetical protein
MLSPLWQLALQRPPLQNEPAPDANVPADARPLRQTSTDVQLRLTRFAPDGTIPRRAIATLLQLGRDKEYDLGVG